MIIRKRAFARGALVGNPSDGYFGKTIAFTFRDFSAEVVLYESPELEILPSARDHSAFGSIGALVEDVNLFGYYGGIRLLKATVKRFHDVCRERGIVLHDRNFTLRYSSTIPHLVGLAGSSAIIVATIRCLLAYYGVTIPPPELANIVLSVERDELHISAGLQDRVAQVYGGLVYMDFDRAQMERRGYGVYEAMDAALLPDLYIAYQADLSQGSDVVHHSLRERFRRGETEVVEAMSFWADLTDRVCEALREGRRDAIGPLLDANFDRRATLYDVGEGNRRMVEAARSVGASAKLTGSGGAIVGTYEGDDMFAALEQALAPLGARTLKPQVCRPLEGDIG